MTLALRVKSLSRPGVLYNATYIGRRWACDCPDSRYRGRRCKHVQILALLARRMRGVRRLVALAGGTR